MVTWEIGTELEWVVRIVIPWIVASMGVAAGRSLLPGRAHGKRRRWFACRIAVGTLHSRPRFLVRRPVLPEFLSNSVGEELPREHIWTCHTRIGDQIRDDNPPVGHPHGTLSSILRFAVEVH